MPRATVFSGWLPPAVYFPKFLELTSKSRHGETLRSNLAFLLFGLAYEGMAYHERIYSLFNRTSTAFLGIALLAAVGRWLHAYLALARALRAAPAAAAGAAAFGRHPAPAISRLDPTVAAASKLAASPAAQPRRAAAKPPAVALRNLLVFSVLALGPSIAIAVANALQGFPPGSYLGYSSFLLPLGLATVALQNARRPVPGTAAGNPERFVS